MFALSFDSTISISDLLLIGGGIIAVVKMFLIQRDTLLTIGNQLKQHGEEIERIGRRQSQHHDWLVGSGLDRRRFVREEDAE